MRAGKAATGFGSSYLTSGCLYVPATYFFSSHPDCQSVFPVNPVNLLIAEGLPVGFTEEWFWFVLCVFKGLGRTQRTELQTQSELAELGITCC